jgi:hypothetical protein
MVNGTVSDRLFDTVEDCRFPYAWATISEEEKHKCKTCDILVEVGILKVEYAISDPLKQIETAT